MTSGITLTRTGDSNWYIKGTNFNDTPERSAAWVKSVCCVYNVTETTDNE